MKTVQTLRARAQAAGNLQSGPQQMVTVAPSASADNSPDVIVIHSKDPEVVYVPTYDPTVVYGAWPAATAAAPAIRTACSGRAATRAIRSAPWAN